MSLSFIVGVDTKDIDRIPEQKNRLLNFVNQGDGLRSGFALQRLTVGIAQEFAINLQKFIQDQQNMFVEKYEIPLSIQQNSRFSFGCMNESKVQANTEVEIMVNLPSLKRESSDAPS